MATILPIKPDDNLEIFSLIWLDSAVNESSENLDCQRKLRNSINYLKTFDDSDRCERYIQNLSSNDRLILIVSGRFGQEILPSIHNLRQVIAIYVYCMHKQSNEQWTKKFNKVQPFVSDPNNFVIRFRLNPL
jgi:hypothetical protein